MNINREHQEKEPLLTIDRVNLTLTDGNGKPHLILRDVDECIHDIIRPGVFQGQVVGLLGPSGIGKTQLFKIIAGFNIPDSGRVLVGQDQKPTAPGEVGVVTQDYKLFPHMRVIDNLVFAGTQGGLSRKESMAQADAYLVDFDLADHRNDWPANLSGGQRQRVSILRQIMVGHKFICMDEPFSGLDVNQLHKVCHLISELTSKDELLTFIVVTHDIGAAIEVSDTLWLLGKEWDDTQKKFLDGARIVGKTDLVAEGLAWDPDIRQNPDFARLQALITAKFAEMQRKS